MTKFFFEGESYVAFEKPTEVPDEIVKEEIKCLFFDEFNSNNYNFHYLDGDFDNATYDSIDESPFKDNSNTYFKFCAISEKLYNVIKLYNEIKRENSSSNKNNKGGK